MEQVGEVVPKKKSLLWLWIVLGLVIVVGGIYGYMYLSQPRHELTTDKSSNSKSDATISENWVIASAATRVNTTSTDTHKISDNLYRTYFMSNGGISYYESTDGVSLGAGKSTGVTEPSGKMISNPAVLQISDSSWIMIYEMAPTRTPGSNNQPAGPSNERDLYLATSTDGKSFTYVGMAIDSSKEDKYFASVPDLVKLPNDIIRMYYVSGGNATASAMSGDGGKTWVRDEDYRIDGAVDPDVSVKGDQWVMYYSVLDPAKNGIYKATSEDGMIWENKTKLFTATTNGAAIDPDVFPLADGTYAMFFGQSVSGGSTGGETISLYRATLAGDIFN